MSTSNLKRKAVLAAVVAGVVGLGMLYFFMGHSVFFLLAEACEWIRNNRVVGALLFIPCEAIWVCSCVPTTPLELAAGYAFGVEFGFWVDTLGKLIGCVISFSLGRHCLREFAMRSCLSGEFGADLLRAVDSSLAASPEKKDLSLPSWESIQLLLLIQLAYIPVALKNYGLSLTTVSFGAFFATSLLGEMPSTFAIVWTGASTADLVALLSGESTMTPGQIFTTALGACSLGLLMVLLGVRVHQRLKELSPSAVAGTSAPSGGDGKRSAGEKKPLIPLEDRVL
jgi:uncharacterized membrane protein YdjX (TVP38/TMEM64 family)